jgi:phage repressor protein C with HTH and peptisase S24 domain
MLYDQLTSSLEDTTMRYVGVKYIPDVTGSCGGGSEFSLVDDYEIVKFPWYMLEELKIKSHIDNIHIIDIVGDSMEPALKDKDRVFVDISKTEFNTKDIFVLSTPYGIYVKKLSRCDGKYTLHSLNKLYYAEEVEYDIEIIGTVVGKF